MIKNIVMQTYLCLFVDEPERLYSLLGVAIIILIGFLLSAHPGHVKWRNVLWGVGLEFTLGLLVLRWDVSTIFKTN